MTTDLKRELNEAFREFDAADRDLSKTRLSKASTGGDILAARLRFDAADRNVNEILELGRRKNPRKKSKSKKKQKLWAKVKKGSKTKTGHGAIGAGAGALLLGPIGAIAGAYIGSKQHKGKKKRKKNPEPMITLTDSYARMLAECCGSPEETEAFSAIDLLVYQVLVEKQPVALSLIIDAYNDLKKLKKLQSDPVTKEVIEGFEESLEYQIEKATNPRAFKLATEVARGRRRKTERGASSIASAERGARSARKSSVGRTLRSLNPGWASSSTYSAYEGKLARMSDSAVNAEHKKLEKMLANSRDPQKDFGTIGLPMLKRMIGLSSAETKRRGPNANPRGFDPSSPRLQPAGTRVKYIVYSSKTGKKYGPYKSKRRARSKLDSADNAYGSYVYQIWQIADEDGDQNDPLTGNPPALEILEQFDKGTPGPNQLSYIQARILSRLLSNPEIHMGKVLWRATGTSYLKLLHQLEARGLIEIGPASGPHKDPDADVMKKAEPVYDLDWVRLTDEGIRYSKENRIPELVARLESGPAPQAKRRAAAVDMISRSGPKKGLPNPPHPYLKKCRETWERCCSSPTVTRLRACRKRFEKGLKHKDLDVRKECRQGLRACKAAMKEHGAT